MSVFVLDRRGKPLMPCSEKRASKLLASGRARVHRLTPFVIRLVDVSAQDCALQPLMVKIDPGSNRPSNLTKVLQRGDGYGYQQQPKIALASKGCGTQGAATQPALSLLPMNGEVSRASQR